MTHIQQWACCAVESSPHLDGLSETMGGSAQGIFIPVSYKAERAFSSALSPASVMWSRWVNICIGCPLMDIFVYDCYLLLINKMGLNITYQWMSWLSVKSELLGHADFTNKRKKAIMPHLMFVLFGMQICFKLKVPYVGLLGNIIIM